MAQRKLRILQVLRAPIGGLYRHVSDLSAALCARGHDVGIIMASDQEYAQTEVRLSPIHQQLTLGVHRLPMARLFGVSDITTPIALRKLMQKLDVDIVHGHGAKGGFHARLARLGQAQPAALYTPHGGALHFAPNTPAGFIFDRIERSLFGLTEGVIFESAYAQQVYFDRIGQPRCAAPIIHNGLADDEFEPVAPDANAADFAFIGELRTLKGIMHLLDALVDVSAPDGRPATLVIAGDGALRTGIEARVAQDDLKGRVRLLGIQPARSVFAQAQCVVVPSLAESLPYVVLEAAAASKPVIATKVGGVSEIFGETADDLIPAGDSDALSKAMRDTLSDPAKAVRQMETRRNHVRDNFSIAGMVDKIEQFYQSVLPT